MRTLAEKLNIRPTKKLGQNFVIDGRTVRKIVPRGGAPRRRRRHRGRARSGVADAGAAVGGGRGRRRRDRSGAGTAAPLLEVLVTIMLPGVLRPAPGRRGRRAAHPRRPAAPSRPRWSPTALQRLGPGRAPPAADPARAARRHRSWCSRRSPTGWPRGPGRASRHPSVKAAWYADVRRRRPVEAQRLPAAPNVDSGLVSGRREPPTTTATREAVFAAIDAAFTQRRKTLPGRPGGLGGFPGGGRGGARQGGGRPEGAGRTARRGRLRPEIAEHRR